MMADNEKTRYKIEYDREGCIGAAACVAVCPENWRLEEDGKAGFNKGGLKESEFEINMEAARVCPVNVIHIIDKKTNQKLI